jgi:hypothetical protein
MRPSKFLNKKRPDRRKIESPPVVLGTTEKWRMRSESEPSSESSALKDRR